MIKLRVYHIPQVPMKAFYVPVKSVAEGKKVMDILAAYDAFQFENNIKPDYCNINGLEVFDEGEQEWVSWDIETENYCYDDVYEYCMSGECEGSEEVLEDSKEILGQVNWNKIERMTK